MGSFSLLPGPVTYYDVQKLYSIQYENRKARRALEYAIDHLEIEKNQGFHRALADAYYTAEVLEAYGKIQCSFEFLHRCLSEPKEEKKEEIHISYPTYDKFVSREFLSREKAMKDREVISVRCPACRQLTKRKIRWFINNSKIYESISFCQEHGYVKGKIRIRKTDEEKYYAIKTIKNVDVEKAEEIRQKRESLRRKKQMKKLSEKEV